MHAMSPTRIVGQPGPQSASSEIDANDHLEGKSRLIAETQDGSGTQYRVLETIRQYANEKLADLLTDLLSRCSLIALMYQSSHSAAHSAGEHIAIVDAIERRDARAAARLMAAHLANVERNLQLHPRVRDLAAALQTA